MKTSNKIRSGVFIIKRIVLRYDNAGLRWQITKRKSSTPIFTTHFDVVGQECI